eukprot:scaffold247198_cov15-Tisochrysis_lutea.AAC.1
MFGMLRECKDACCRHEELNETVLGGPFMGTTCANCSYSGSISQVETAGDCYIVSSGVLSDQTYNGFSCTLDHHDRPGVSAGRVMEFAKAVLQETAKVGCKVRMQSDSRMERSICLTAQTRCRCEWASIQEMLCL